MYGRRGLVATDVAKVILFSAFTFWLGFAVLAGSMFVFEPPRLPAGVPLASGLLPWFGIALLALVVLYLAFAVLRRTPVHWARFGLTVDPPGGRVAALQLLISTADWIVSASVLYVLLPPLQGLGFGGFLAVFFLAQVGGLLSHVPGGLGVFESVTLACLAGTAPPAQLLGALVAWRAIYFLLPLVLAGTLFLVDEVPAWRRSSVTGGS